eukprot:gene23441-29659_t
MVHPYLQFRLRMARHGLRQFLASLANSLEITLLVFAPVAVGLAAAIALPGMLAVRLHWPAMLAILAAQALARSILAEMADLEQQLGASRSTPSGLLRVNATLGFGRSHIGPLISRFVRQYPQVDAQLQLSVDPPALTDDAFDVCIRFGPPPDTRVIARKIASNQRLLCASPAYLQAHGEPKTPAELTRHNFISIRQGGEAYGVVKLTRGKQGSSEAIKTRGNLTTNDGSIAVQWALDGHGLLLRAEWDIRQHLASGQLVQVLPQHHTPDADIYAVYPAQHKSAARVRAFVDFAAEAFTPLGA